jgi:hypothetical protein
LIVMGAMVYENWDKRNSVNRDETSVQDGVFHHLCTKLYTNTENYFRHHSYRTTSRRTRFPSLSQPRNPPTTTHIHLRLWPSSTARLAKRPAKSPIEKMHVDCHIPCTPIQFSHFASSSAFERNALVPALLCIDSVAS